MPLQFNPFTGTFDVTTKGDTGTVAAAGDGTAAAPGITFASDTNTGIYRPGADQLALSTNGTGTLYIDASGRIGNGVSSPASLSTVYRSTINGDGSTIVGGLSLRNNGTETLTIGNITAANNTDVEIWNPRNGYLRFATNNTERLRITSAGLVGIGTSTPVDTLHVSGGITVQGTDSAFSTTSVHPRIYRSGTASGTYPFNAFDNLILQTRSDGTLADIVFATGGGGSQRMVFTGGGRLGIGTTGPQATLHVSNPGASNNGTIWLGSATFYGLIEHDAALTGSNIYTCSTASGGGHIFRRGSTEQMRLDANSRLLVGTTSARANFFNGALSALFQVEGANAGNNRSSSFVYGQSNASGPIITLGKHRSDLVGGITAVIADDQIGSIAFQGSDGTDLVAGAQISAFVDGTPGADDMPGRLVFSTTADGAASPTERMRIKANGTINFSNVAVYADNAAATTGGLAVGDVYRTSTGQLMIRY